MSHNTWIHRLIRPAARRLVETPVTPNHITGLRLAGGLAAAGAFAVGEASWRDLGAGLFFISFFLDRLDGELARLSGMKSAFGHKLDLASDSLANAAAFIGLGLGLTTGVFGAWAAAMGLLAGVSIAAVLLLVMRLEVSRGERAGELGGFAGFDADDAVIVVPFFVWAGQSELLLLMAGLGAPLFAIYYFLRFSGRAWGKKRDV